LIYVSLGCNACHGNDGKALIEVVANATDLTNPSVWKNGTEEGLIYRSIRDGAGLSMPQVDDQQDIWHLGPMRGHFPDDHRLSASLAPKALMSADLLIFVGPYYEYRVQRLGVDPELVWS
jgi:hypothetical protein